MSTLCNASPAAENSHPIPKLHAGSSPGNGRLLLEIAIGFGLLEAALWSDGRLRWEWSLAAAVWIIAVTVYRYFSLRELGLGRSGFLASLWVVGIAAAIGAAMLGIGYLAGTVHPYVLRRSLYVAAGGYLFWTLQQQFMLQAFFFNHLERLLGSRKAVWSAATLFAIAHIPNPVLVPATFAAGIAFCEVFRRYRNIYTLAIAQALLGICLAAAVPEAFHHHMRVGLGYLSWIPR